MPEQTVTEEATVAASAEKRGGSGPGFLLGVVLGGLAGAAAATLLAPPVDEGQQSSLADSPFPSSATGHPPETPEDRVRALFAQLRARVGEAAEEGRMAAKEAEEKSRARYAELIQQERPST